MSWTPDALLSLQRALKSKTPVKFTDAASNSVANLPAASHIQLQHGALPKTTPTRLRKPNASSTDPIANPDDFFSLCAVYLAWANKDASGADYLRKMRENGLGVGGYPNVTERKNVVDWLEGKISHLDNIVPLPSDSTTPPGSPSPSVLALHRPSGASSASASSSRLHDSSFTPSKRRYVADPADIEVVKKIKTHEIELRDRNTVLRGIKKNNFGNVRTAFTEKLKKMKEAGKSGSMTQAPTPDPKLQARKAKNQYPIIMISSSPTALITMHNVKSFLQESQYVPSQEAKAQAAAEGNARPEDLIAIYRKRTGIDSAGRETESHARYFVVDSTEALAKFGTDAWDRVVCVMTTGQAWQFKPYKWNDPKVLFHHVKGIYVSLSTDPSNGKIQDWNVTELKIDPHRRHVDRAVVAHFWKILDTWTMANKPWLVKA
ncbi:accessory factor associated with RNA polymerase II [Steccherinum ochraceum]|uniref:Accessory factor associated with RNA polymerase II n=1 Tax=Steccherinum ochraceum TaxID=92696 RepID=A0A4R0RKE9_9APHY|nr:accessory factor associated with RNA polymerase II [Steccherinum ochraceum]